MAVFALGMLLSLVPRLRRLAAGAGPDRRRAAGGGGRPLGARARGGHATRSARSPAPSTRWWSGSAESRALEERLRVAERSTAMGRFASALAHEIRNPLNSISLTIDHVRTRLAPEDEARRAEFEALMATLKSEVARLNRLVGDFLSSGQPARLDPRPCDVGAVVRETAALVEHKAREQAIDVERGRGRRAARDARRPRAAQDLPPQPRAERVRGDARGRPAAARGPARGRRRSGRSRSLVADTGVGMSPDAAAQRLRALLLDEGGRRRPRPRPRAADRRGPRRHDRARLGARPRHDGAPRAAACARRAERGRAAAQGARA